jgi:hypothetical protein
LKKLAQGPDPPARLGDFRDISLYSGFQGEKQLNTIQIVSGVLAIILVIIIVLRRKNKKKVEEDDF